MPLIRYYGIQLVDTNEFDANFEIPDNCNYTVSYDATKKINTVTIQLNSGQSSPSSNFVTQNYTFNGDNGILDLRFDQKLNGISLVKPKIRIEGI